MQEYLKTNRLIGTGGVEIKQGESLEQYLARAHSQRLIDQGASAHAKLPGAALNPDAAPKGAPVVSEKPPARPLEYDPEPYRPLGTTSPASRGGAIDASQIGVPRAPEGKLVYDPPPFVPFEMPPPKR
jgi:hypothetical protein